MRWIDATDLENWASRRDSEEYLPFLIRRLIRATLNRNKIGICLAPFYNHPITGVFTREGILLTYFQYIISYVIPR